MVVAIVGVWVRVCVVRAMHMQPPGPLCTCHPAWVHSHADTAYLLQLFQTAHCLHIGGSSTPELPFGLP